MDIKEVIKIFETSNDFFLIKNRKLFEAKISERALCGALMIELRNCIDNDFKEYASYFVDIEYNRFKNPNLEYCVKSIKGPKQGMLNITCDLLVHGRDTSKVPVENLIAIEMKKSNRNTIAKNLDRYRLKVLTDEEPQTNNVIYNYFLGIYYEINYREQKVIIEYYSKGYLIETSIVNFK